MRFRLFHLLLVMTGVSVLCAVVVNVPETRGVLAAFVFGGGLSLLAASAGDTRFGRWLHATLGAWLVLAAFAYLASGDSSFGSLQVAEAIAATGAFACFIGTAVAMAVGRR